MDLLYVGVARHSGPVLGEDVLTELVLLAEPGGSEPCTFEPEVEAADA